MKRCFLLALAPLVGSALEVKPWLGNEWEFQFDTAYTYSRYPNVQDGHPALRSPSNDQLLTFDLGVVAPTPNWDFQLEAEIANTPRQSWGVRSGAVQARYQWLDDILGDPVSLTIGANLRVVAHHSLRDVSCPYHSYVNGEINGAVGKEWSKQAFWRWRAFAFAGVGMANRGSPWTRALISFMGNQEDRHQYAVFAIGYWGFGTQREVMTRDFDGYGKIHHQSIDLGLGYRYLLDFWGSFTFSYAYRLYARSFPERVNFFTLAYELPFSPF